jgi:hypothetical protein
MKTKQPTPAEIGDLFKFRKFENRVETQEGITPRMVRMEGKRRMVDALKRKAARDLLDRLPEEGEFFHIVSDGKFDYWSLVPIIVEMAGLRNVELHASTWTLNRPNALEMLEMIDDGRLSKINLLTGTYFKRRESAVYATIANGLAARGSRIRCLENHAKVAILNVGNSGFIMEGSANFTANPRIEQNIVAKSAELYAHHKKWIEEVFALE